MLTDLYCENSFHGEIAVDREPAVAVTSKPWPESHPLITLIAFTVLGLAFVVWTAVAVIDNYFAELF